LKLGLLVYRLIYQSKQIFGNCDVSSYDVSSYDANFPPNHILMSFVYLTQGDMAVSRGGLVSKDPCNIQKNPKGPQNSFKRTYIETMQRALQNTLTVIFGGNLQISLIRFLL
jgi:hypothetical protein